MFIQVTDYGAHEVSANGGTNGGNVYMSKRGGCFNGIRGLMCKTKMVK
jgi:hypothetical protein